ncbi:MAG: class I SAM-dependent methyltransferase [Gemmobacter sp.]
MLTPHRKRYDDATAIERRAAPIADAIATQLLRPTSERSPVADLLADLRDLMAPAQGHLPHLRHTDATALAGRLRAWPRVQQAAELCAAGQVWPLMPPPPDPLDPLSVQGLMLSSAFTTLHFAVSSRPQTDHAEGMGLFPDLPLDAARFLANAHLALRVLLAQKRQGPFRFIDVGCGGGLKVVLASEVFQTADGLEYDAGYAEIGRRTIATMRSRRCTVTEGDGLTFDGYGGYDVIYFYQPMRVEFGLHDLEERIVEQARPGTILIAPYLIFSERAQSLGCAGIAGSVYVKGLDPDQATVLATEAARMGPHIVNPTGRLTRRLGWLAPLAQACEMNGIRPGYRGGGLSALL